MNELSTLIDALSEKLGVAAGELYSVMQTQARLFIVKGPVGCVLYLCTIIFTIVFIKRVFFDRTRTIDSYEKKDVSLFEYHEEECNDGRMAMYVVAAVVLAFVSVICFFLMLSALSDVVTCIYNPKYWALDKILSYLK